MEPMNYMRHPHRAYDGTIWHTHVIDEFEAEDPHTWDDHLRDQGQLQEVKKMFEPKNVNHPMANVLDPNAPKPGTYDRMREEYRELARGYSDETLEALLIDGRRNEWLHSKDPHKTAVCHALMDVRAARKENA